MSDDRCSIRDVDKIYQPRGRRRCMRSTRSSMDVGRRRDRGAAGLVGLRQDLDPADGRGLRGRQRGRHPARRIGGSTSCGRRQRNVAMAFEGYALYPPLTIRDNIAFALLRGRLPARGGGARVRQIAELLEIDRHPRPLSAPRSRAASSSAQPGPGPGARAPTSICSTSRCRSSSRSCGRSCAPGSRTV